MKAQAAAEREENGDKSGAAGSKKVSDGEEEDGKGDDSDAEGESDEEGRRKKRKCKGKNRRARRRIRKATKTKRNPTLIPLPPTPSRTGGHALRRMEQGRTEALPHTTRKDHCKQEQEASEGCRCGSFGTHSVISQGGRAGS